MSTKVDCEELSTIPLTDTFDDNDNCITQCDVNETIVHHGSQPRTGSNYSGFGHTVPFDVPVKSSTAGSRCQPKDDDRRRRSWAGQRLSRDIARRLAEASESSVVSDGTNRRPSSAFDDLLFEIYDRWHYGWRGSDSLDSDTYTDLTAESDAFVGYGGDSVLHGAISESDGDTKHRLSRTNLESKDVTELRKMVADLRSCVNQLSSTLIRQLKRRDRYMAAVQSNCDVVTAILHASSLKRSIDSKIRFSIEPLPGDESFAQWKGAMKAMARIPVGIPPLFRQKVWLTLADNYLHSVCIDWEKTKRFTFNEKSNPDDNKLGLQIVKDLHRTGCSGFSGRDNDEERAVLKRVLLAYARWNKEIGYCQGFNIIAALILDVMDRREDCALKVMIYLIDHVLPENYFANNLRALSVDMAVFRELLQTQLPQLSLHLKHLQEAAKDQTTGASYEPPLTNVFTMQWFLTLFATCLPKSTALHVWDSILLEGSEILLHTAVAIWALLEDRIMLIQDADDFYTSMAKWTQEMLDGKIFTTDSLVKKVYSMAPFPLVSLAEQREKYTYNITPFTATVKHGQNKSLTGLDEELEKCFDSLDSGDEGWKSGQSADISQVGPGAYNAHPEEFNVGLAACSERASLDIDMLNRRYKRLKERQKQAHVILAVANADEDRKKQEAHSLRKSQEKPIGQRLVTIVAPIERPAIVNHLFISSDVCPTDRNRAVVQAPTIASSFYCPVKVTSSVSAPQPPSGRSQSVASITSLLSTGSGSDRQTNSRTSENSSPAANRVVPNNATDCSTGSASSVACSNNQTSSCHQSHSANETKADLIGSGSGVVGSSRSDDDKPCGVDTTNSVTTGDENIELINLDDNTCCQPRDAVQRSVANVADGLRSASHVTSDVFRSGSPAPETSRATNAARTDGGEKPSPAVNLERRRPDVVVATPNDHSSARNQASVYGSSSSSPASVLLAKSFNPFPRQHVSEQRARNGIRLRMYSASDDASGTSSMAAAATAVDEKTGRRTSCSELSSRQRQYNNICLRKMSNGVVNK